MSNQLQNQTKANLVQYLDAPNVVTRLSEKLGLEETKKFKAAISSAVSTNPALLYESEPQTVVSSFLVGHSLGLPPSPQLGYYYVVPYNKKGHDLKIATFQMGYRGYIQLAMRSGCYRKLNVCEIKEGEFKGFNPVTEDLKISIIEDPLEREKRPTVGYCAFFEYLNGFNKLLYWTRQQTELHADKYSAAYSLASDKLLKEGKIPKKDMWKYSSYWYTDFDGMGKKTLLRQLLSKWGSMSVEMQKAYEEDIKADSVPFEDAQKVAQNNIDDETGSEVIDANFEDIADPNAEPDPEFQAKKQATQDKLNNVNTDPNKAPFRR